MIITYLDIDYSTFLNIIHDDVTCPVRKVGGQWKADPAELKEWFRSQGKQTNTGNVVEINRSRRGRPPLSGTSPRTKAK
jgi:hypothetical protein